MNRILAAASLAACAAIPAQANTNVGVSVAIGQPGFQGRIDIGNYPQPALIYPQPVVIQPVPVAVVRHPIYLNVPPGHSKNWAKHCHRYAACDQPVYFVRNDWYERTYVPEYRRRHHDDRGHHHHGRHDHHDRHDHDHDHDHGRGHGKGKGRD